MTIDIRIETTFNNKYIGEWDLPEDGSDPVAEQKPGTTGSQLSTS